MPKREIKKAENQKKEKKPATSKFQRQAALLLIVIIGALLLYLFRGLLVVATVNNQPIARISLIQELEKQSGKQALDSIITKTLILQQASKQNIAISKTEIDNEIKNIEDNLKKQGQTLDMALASSNMKRSDLVEQIKVQKIIEKMFAKDVKITEKDIDNYIKENKITTEENTKPEEIKQQVKQQLEQQELGKKFQNFIAEAKQKAKINYYIGF